MNTNTRRRSIWGAIGAALGAVLDVAVQVLPDALLGAKGAIAGGQVSPGGIGTGALIGAASGVLARWGLDLVRKPKPQEPPKVH